MTSTRYYAVDGQVGTFSDPAELPPGAVEMAYEQYEAAIDAMQRGLVVKVQNGGVDMVPPPEPEPEVVLPREPTLADFRAALAVHVDAVAQARQYDSGISCASYVGSSNLMWAAEAQAFVLWRDAFWQRAFEELANVQAGLRPQPTIEGFVEEMATHLPMVWPE